jgi:hypothetical protein
VAATRRMIERTQHCCETMALRPLGPTVAASAICATKRG